MKYISIIILLTISSVAIFSPFFIDYNPNLMDLSLRACQPSKEHILGCDLYGRDLLSGLIIGSQITMYISTSIVLITCLIGLFIGLSAGFFGGLFDLIVVRIIDLFLAFPGILLAMFLISLLGPNINNIIISISITGWTSIARICRSQVISLKSKEYIIANQAIGSSKFRTLIKHIFPATLVQLMTIASFSFSSVIIAEASLSFLGLGSPSNIPTWGNLISQGREVLAERPHLSLAPGILIMAVVLAFNILGDSLQEYLNPKIRKTKFKNKIKKNI